MPEIKEIVKRRINRLETVPDVLITGTANSQIEILSKALDLLNTLDVSNGKFITSDANLAKVEEIVQLLNDAVFETKYKDQVIQFLREFDLQSSIQNEYFISVLKNVGAESFGVFSQLVETAKKNAADLLGRNAVDVAFGDPIREILNKSVSEGVFYKDAVKTLKDSIIGMPEEDGLLLRYVKQIARDTFTVGDREYHLGVAQYYNVGWWQYVGGVGPTSRQFCRNLAGGYYTTEQIQAWPERYGEWQGRAEGTNASTIFGYAGGYNCTHVLLAVAESAVPEEFKQ